jgi:PAS domain S-box-containing protein
MFVAELFGVALVVCLLVGGAVWAVTVRRELDRRAQVLDITAATSHEWQWETDVDDVFTYNSDAVLDLLGYRPDELLGTTSFDLLFDDAARSRAIPLRDAATGSPDGWADRELIWRHRDGSPVRLEGSAAALRGHRGHVVGYRGTRRLVSRHRPGHDVVKGARDRISAVLADAGVRVALQPIVSLAAGQVVGVEALARFHDGRGPDAWFHDADLAGRTRELDELTFTTALSTFAALPPDVYLSVNASPDLLMDPGFRDRIAGLAVPRSRLVVEITEHARVADYSALNDALAPLRAQGVRFAIDDTGAGYASLTHVLKLHPDIIKLDRDLIDTLDTDAARRSLVTALVLLALDIGATITGEGVETSDQIEALISLGADQAQGYHLARPSTNRSDWDRWWTHDFLAASVDS